MPLTQLLRFLKAVHGAALIAPAMMLGLLSCAGSSPERVPGVHPTRTRFLDLVQSLTVMPDTAERARAASALARKLQGSHREFMQDSTAYLWYEGPAAKVYLAGDFNGWRPDTTALDRVPHTGFFWTDLKLDPASRVEYKLVVDGQWTLDSANPQTARGGFGENSELRMPAYREPTDIQRHSGVPEGTLDTLRFHSAVLGRPFQAYIYIPPHGLEAGTLAPSLTVGDGSDYLSFASMKTVLDNLISQKRLRPLIGVFLEPRSDPQDDRTNTRMKEYMLDSRFMQFLGGELRDTLLQRYPLSSDPRETGIMGASLGGLLSTYAALSLPEVYGVSAAQSPAYWVMNDSIFAIATATSSTPGRVYLQTGNLHDAQEATMRMRDTLVSRGFHVRYQEVPEGHNWSNWRAHLGEILIFMFGGPR
jgi:enterochelin esterase-like enzyme